MKICFLDPKLLESLREVWINNFITSTSESWKEEFDVILDIKESLLYRIESNGFFGDPDHRLNQNTYVAIIDHDENKIEHTIAIAEIIATRRGREHTTKIMSLAIAPSVEIASKEIYDQQYANALAFILAFYVQKNNVKGSITKVYAEDEVAQAFLKNAHERLSKDELKKHSIEVAMQGINWLAFKLLKSN